MQSELPMHQSPRCGAHSRRTGRPCRNGAMPNGRCRMHGGTNKGAPRGEKNGAYHHGLLAAEAVQRRRGVRDLMNESRDLLVKLSVGER